MPEEQQPESVPQSSEKRNPRRRGHRGGRGRGRGRAPREAKEIFTGAATDAADVSPETELPPSPEMVQEPAREQAHEKIREMPEKAETPPPRPSHPQKFAASAVARATEEVRHIVESLEQALEQMEEVLKLVETAERQKIADEREIESLRRALRRIQPPRNPQRESPPEEPAE